MAAVTLVDMRQRVRGRRARRRSSAGRSRGDRRAARAARAGDGPAEPPRLRHQRVLPAVRRDARLSELQRHADRAPGGDGAPAATTATTRSGCRRPARTAQGRTSSTSASAPSGSRRRLSALFPEARIARVDRDTIRRRGAIAAVLQRLRGRRDRRPRRHPDDRQGPRLSAGHAGRRRVGRRRSRPRRLPRRRAHVPAAHAAVTTEARRYPAVLPAPLDSPSCRCICTPVT